MTQKASLTTSILLLVIICGSCFSSCTFKRGSREKTLQEANFSDFTAINASRGLKLKITQDSEYSVSVIAPEKYMDYIKIEQRSTTLYITVEKEWRRLLKSALDDDITVRISMPYITQIDLAKAAEADFIGAFEVPQFSAFLSGASEIDGLTIAAEDVTIEASGASDFSGSVRATHSIVNLSGASELDLTAQQIGQLKMQLSGSSEVELQGSVSNLTVDLSGASEIDGDELTVSDLDVAMSGASSVEVCNNGSLRYNISGASKLIIHGSPKVFDSKSDRSSKVQMR